MTKSRKITLSPKSEICEVLNFLKKESASSTEILSKAIIGKFILMILVPEELTPQQSETKLYVQVCTH